MKSERFTDFDLHAYIDGELAADRKQALLEAMECDGALASRVCELQRTKQWMQSAFEDAEPPAERCEVSAKHSRWVSRCGMAASVLLLLAAFAAGWLARPVQMPDLYSAMIENIETSGYRVVLHIDEADPRKFEQVLLQSERLLGEYRDRGIQVEILANSSGLDLLRADTSPYAQRIASILNRYENFRLVACNNAVDRLRESGITPVFFEGTRTDESAVEHAVRRLREGWSYIKV
ncbi:hypothetical protein TspCOW1_32040 [Thiohalobacter sp. COW1]|uniref:Uncharacterized protein n=1 Tax=Thiohalobacter thiocyanaticus TaxID=585455 RepID=A0A1Z4VU43_9GAMM|nr:MULTISPECIES: hypothetical protein [Thiohalobacter]BAZ94985.1 uncharacterized protein FOKN1_2615 [Thiohalobacter thiocyanaticus]BCO33101.1 hypothetical protein TspCOW1_32040 [Thiohalobacter sp. COW1]